MNFEEFFDTIVKDEGEQQNYDYASDFIFGGMDAGEAKEIYDQKDAVIFLIDCASTMFQANPHNPDSTSSIDQVLRATLQFMKSKVIKSDSDKIAIVLYNCEQSQNTLNFPHIVVYQSLEATDATIIR